jgi:hypothetical protein
LFKDVSEPFLASGFFAMDSIFNEVCISVTAAFALALVPGLRKPERSLQSRRDQGTALLVFTIPGWAPFLGPARSSVVETPSCVEQLAHFHASVAPPDSPRTPHPPAEAAG